MMYLRRLYFKKEKTRQIVLFLHIEIAIKKKDKHRCCEKAIFFNYLFKTHTCLYSIMQSLQST